jgi:hypothetical protein
MTPIEVPSSLILGTNGGGEAIVFNRREERLDRRYPGVAVNFINFINFTSDGWEDALSVAPDFRSLMLLRVNSW